VESQLFGHARGAFTGALDKQAGYFRAAPGLTIAASSGASRRASTFEAREETARIG